jgi:hypothetical protein
MDFCEHGDESSACTKTERILNEFCNCGRETEGSKPSMAKGGFLLKAKVANAPNFTPSKCFHL